MCDGDLASDLLLKLLVVPEAILDIVVAIQLLKQHKEEKDVKYQLAIGALVLGLLSLVLILKSTVQDFKKWRMGRSSKEEPIFQVFPLTAISKVAGDIGDILLLVLLALPDENGVCSLSEEDGKNATLILVFLLISFLSDAFVRLAFVIYERFSTLSAVMALGKFAGRGGMFLFFSLAVVFPASFRNQFSTAGFGVFIGVGYLFTWVALPYSELGTSVADSDKGSVQQREVASGAMCCMNLMHFGAASALLPSLTFGFFYFVFVHSLSEDFVDILTSKATSLDEFTSTVNSHRFQFEFADGCQSPTFIVALLCTTLIACICSLFVIISAVIVICLVPREKLLMEAEERRRKGAEVYSPAFSEGRNDV